MTRKEALAKAIAATQAGTLTGGPDAGVVPRDMSRLIEAIFGDDDEIWSHLVGADDGSIDDAFALHQAVLPGWDYILTNAGEHGGESPGPMAAVGDRDALERGDEPFKASTNILARAWLLSILRALHSMEAI